MFRFITLFFILVIPIFAFNDSIIIKADRMLDVENGKIVESSVLVIEKGYIQAINPKKLPQSPKIIDLGDVTLLPGLIDCHTHLSLGLDLANTWKWDLSYVKNDAGMIALIANQNGQKMLMKGFTTIRELASIHQADINLQKIEALNPKYYPIPRIIPSGYALSVRGGHLDFSSRFIQRLKNGAKEGVIRNDLDLTTAVREQYARGARFIKIAVTGGILSRGTSLGAHFSLREIKIIVDEAKKYGIKTASHAHTRQGIENAILAGVASIEHGSTLDEELITLMKEKGTFLVPTTYALDVIYQRKDKMPPVYRKKLEMIYQLAKKSHKLAIAHKVKIAFGTDTGVFPYEDAVKEFSALVNLGMEEVEVIRAATIYAAELLGVEDRGKIKPGLLADMIAVKGNPLKNIEFMENAVFVMKGGTVYKNTVEK
ncbi:amidohydrolase family protein [Candidatus Uabimicrobium sp. HlEnr_7]|uniref:metal-dependent hydrolase family protein n=1 Tax=Candidatus Uabimicrobium helgolandensis TaxID=3095367 RepID=UPI0035580185